MKKSNQVEVKRGQTISFRIPSDTPDHIVKHLQKLKETERRNFSSKIADYVVEGVANASKKERESITIPLPQRLSKSQRDWLKHEHSEALLGSILFQLLSDPVRATALLASLNSNSVDINDALFLQEEVSASFEKDSIENHPTSQIKETATTVEADGFGDDDFQDFDWEAAKQNISKIEIEDEDKEENLEDLLGDFLSKMNR
ncbi:MAG: hypothetical protein LPK00_08450 [Bacillaceae bacterium]|nr:hypothetical protein [Bacillaceae bacterium]